MGNVVLKYRLQIVGSILGAAFGFLYWHFVGCDSGTCAITSSPLNSSLYGAFVGILLSGAVKKENKKDESDKESGPVGHD